MLIGRQERHKLSWFRERHFSFSPFLLCAVHWQNYSFPFPFLWMGYDRGDSFPFDFEPNGSPFGLQFVWQKMCSKFVKDISFPFNFEQNGFQLGSENRKENRHHDHIPFNLKEKLSSWSYPIQFEREWNTSFLSVWWRWWHPTLLSARRTY